MKCGRGIKAIVKLFIIISMLAVLSITASSEVPQQVNYQGYLTNDVGDPVEGDVQMVFSIYDVPTAGTALWWEEQTVLVINGIYNVQIGQDPTGNPFPGNLFESQRWLGVTVEFDTEMTPRQVLTCTPFAMRAEVADAVVDGAVDTVHIMNNAVTGAKIDNGTVEAVDLSDGTAITEIVDDDGSGSGLDADNLDGHDTAYFATAATVTALQDQVAVLQSQVDQLRELFANVTRPDGNTIRFSDVNVQIVNATGSTAGTPNGLGNLIVGYNEPRSTGSDKSGSHNLIVGEYHNYSSYSGLVVGNFNAISEAGASVTGGTINTASGLYASVSGGYNNTASGMNSSVSAGSNNIASENSSGVSGGHDNTARSIYSSVSAGSYNTASGPTSSVSAGYYNTASGINSSASGGRDNIASLDYASVSGGRNNIASGIYSFVGGGGGNLTTDGNQAFGRYSAILGGKRNISGDPALTDRNIGEYSTVSGGVSNIASGLDSSVCGGGFNTASGRTSSVSGGAYNTASGGAASVSGGGNNTASGGYSFVGGGGDSNPAFGNTAYSYYSAILGGEANVAGDESSGDPSLAQKTTISGGNANTASGPVSHVSGGRNNVASGWYSVVSGGNSMTVSTTDGWTAPGH
jgi:hypothetical protein